MYLQSVSPVRLKIKRLLCWFFFFKGSVIYRKLEEKKKNTPFLPSVPCSFSWIWSSPNTRPSLDHFPFWEILVDHVRTVPPSWSTFQSQSYSFCQFSESLLPTGTWILFQLNARLPPHYSHSYMFGAVVKENWKSRPSDFNVLYVRKWKLRARKNEPVFLWNHRRYF